MIQVDLWTLIQKFLLNALFEPSVENVAIFISKNIPSNISNIYSWNNNLQ